MKIIIVGASGTIGKHVVAALKNDHEIITAGSKSGDYQVDISSTESIENFFKQVGKRDDIVQRAFQVMRGNVGYLSQVDSCILYFCLFL